MAIPRSESHPQAESENQEVHRADPDSVLYTPYAIPAKPSRRFRDPIVSRKDLLVPPEDVNS